MVMVLDSILNRFFIISNLDIGKTVLIFALENSSPTYTGTRKKKFYLKSNIRFRRCYNNIRG